jgi:magnesium-transporting ATPase (P-type)
MQVTRLIPLKVDSLFLRGTTLRNTAWVVGVVIFTGHETKALLNSRQAPHKRSRCVVCLHLYCGLSHKIFLSQYKEVVK